jgi:hypothetical protein
VSRELRKAIQLRLWTRQAITVGDDAAMVALNRKADAAYAVLSENDAAEYRRVIMTPDVMRELHALWRRIK